MRRESLVAIFILGSVQVCLSVCLSGCQVRLNVGGNAPARDEKSEPAPQPAHTIETGLKDAWNLKTTGPTHMAVSPDGKYLLTLAMSSKENVQVWDLRTRTKVRGIDNDIGTMHAHIAIAPDSRTAAYVQLRPKGGIVIFDMPSGNVKQRISDTRSNQIIDSYSIGRSLVFSPDGSLILYGGRQIGAWDTATGKIQLGWSGSSHCLTPFFDQGNKIALLEGGSITIRETTRKGTVLQTLNVGKCDAIAISKDEKTLIGGTNQHFSCWALPGGELRKEFVMEMGTYQHIVPFPHLPNMAAWPTNNGFIICDLESGTQKQRVKTCEPYVTALAITPDGSMLLEAATDGKIRCWKLGENGLVL
jgi:WD40 repeat protein